MFTNDEKYDINHKMVFKSFRFEPWRIRSMGVEYETMEIGKGNLLSN